MHLSPEERDLVLKILKQQVPEYEVVAFGSRVHGKNLKPFSDLDLAVKARKPLSTAVLASLRNAFSESNLPFKVDVVDWASASEAFRAIIASAPAILQKPAIHPSARK